jgi:hypothetical protein
LNLISELVHHGSREEAAGRRCDTDQPDRDSKPNIYSLVSWFAMGGKRGVSRSRCETENRTGERGSVGSNRQTENGRGSETPSRRKAVVKLLRA